MKHVKQKTSHVILRHSVKRESAKLYTSRGISFGRANDAPVETFDRTGNKKQNPY